ncbi:MAG: GntR family transcriptional regulator [Candidatus Thiodiazotropha sp.]
MPKQYQRVLSELRQMIISGEIAAGERLIEIPTAKQFSVSRMPVRIAFRTLEQEGLLTKLPGRGYSVRELSADEINGAVEVRGVLEGLAAGQAAKRGLNETLRQELIESLVQGDALFDKGHITEEDIETYNILNKRFHELIVEASGNPAIAAALARGEHLPFVSINSVTLDRNHLDQEFQRFNFAHWQHHTVFDAIQKGESVRAEAIMREHANAALAYTTLFNRQPSKNKQVQVIRIHAKSGQEN